METIAALIIAISLEVGVPPELVLSIALTENWTLNPTAVSKPNRDGSRDHGIMQLNDRYFPITYCAETNIRTGAEHIKWLMQIHRDNTFFSLAISYNAGHSWFVHGDNPPSSSVNYARKVMTKWAELDPQHPILVR